MKRLLTICSLLAILVSIPVYGCCQYDDYCFYIKVCSGVSCSQAANISAPNPPWNPAIQGYNARLGNSPIAGVSIGYELKHALDLEFNLSNRSTFKYRKCQTPAPGSASYTRKFDLNITSILFSVYLLGRGLCDLHWDVCCGKIYPIVGAGLGVSNLLITNYRTTGLAPTGGSTPYASFSAENQYTLRKHVTYTVFLGIEYNRCDRWAMGTGYRWFDAGHFKGPRYQRVANGSAVDVACDAWKIAFKAHEWFVEFKIYI